MDKSLIGNVLKSVFAFCLISVLVSDLSYGAAIIKVDLTTVKQEIEGFGGNGAFYESSLSAHPQKEEVYNIVFGGLGTSIYRIRNSYEIPYEDDMQHQAEAIQAAEISLGHPVKIMISSWTPPINLKSNGAINGGTLVRQNPEGPTNQTNPYKYDEFAEWWANSLIAYKKLNITATYITIQNEPSLSLNYPSCKFSESETTSWAGYDSALDAVYQKLSTMEESPKILGPDTVNTRSAKRYIDAISDLTQIYGYAHHLYGEGEGNTQADKFDNPDSFIPAMRTFRNYFGDKPIFQTEFCRLYNSDGFREAINTAMHIHNSLVEEDVVAYMAWGLFWPKNIGQDGLGLVLIDDPWNTSEPGYTIKDTYYAFKHYSKYIQPGYRRINISDPKVSGLRASAFKSPDADTVVLVIINPQAVSQEFSVSGLNAYSLCQVFRTDSSPVNKCANITNDWDGNLPGKSITTLICKSNCDFPRFVDVPPGYWAEEAIYKILSAGITAGCSRIPPRYCPEDTVTRAQKAAFIVRAVEGEPPPDYCDSGSPFSDVPTTHPMCKYIKRLSELGITTGYSDGTYRPTLSVNRAQMAAFIVRAVEGEPPANYCDTGSPFTDIDPSFPMCKYIKRLYELGITTGYSDGTYRPTLFVNRTQMAAFLARAFLGMN